MYSNLGDNYSRFDYWNFTSTPKVLKQRNAVVYTAITNSQRESLLAERRRSIGIKYEPRDEPVPVKKVRFIDVEQMPPKYGLVGRNGTSRAAPATATNAELKKTSAKGKEQENNNWRNTEIATGEIIAKHPTFRNFMPADFNTFKRPAGYNYSNRGPALDAAFGDGRGEDAGAVNHNWYDPDLGPEDRARDNSLRNLVIARAHCGKYDYGLGFGDNVYGGHPLYPGRDTGMSPMVHEDRAIIVSKAAKKTKKEAGTRLNLLKEIANRTNNAVERRWLLMRLKKNPNLLNNPLIPQKVSTLVPEKVVAKKEPISPERAKPPPMTLYKQLEALSERDGCITNAEEFDCMICITTTAIGECVLLRLCLHQFCSDCIKSTIILSEDAEIACPYGDGTNKCEGVIVDSEIRAMLSPDEYNKYLSRSLRVAGGTIANTVHCKKVNCDGWCIFDEPILVNQFLCPKCESPNCISCQAIHEGLNCQQYQEQIKHEAVDDRTTKYLEEMIAKNESMKCPKCQIIIMKEEGCEWVCCSICRTEICWVTKQARWGPKGKGDISGGCRCKVDGKPCHPDCNYCH